MRASSSSKFILPFLHDETAVLRYPHAIEPVEAFIQARQLETLVGSGDGDVGETGDFGRGFATRRADPIARL
jgi:hypothetical protein